MKLRCTDIARVALGEPAMRRGQELLYQCPGHDDVHPSLAINPHKNVWMCGPCAVGGTAWALAAFLARCDPSDKASVTAWLEQHALLSPKGGGATILATYDYVDERDKLLFQVVRYAPKAFKQRRPDGVSGWKWNLNGVRRVLFRLPEVLAADNVIIVEGEKDVERLREELRRCNLLGPWAVTCNPGGAGKWRAEYSQHLNGKHVYVICDRDEPGVAHGKSVADSLFGVAKEIRLVEELSVAGVETRPKDVAAFFELGGDWDQLCHLVEKASLLAPEVVSAWVTSKASKTKGRLGPVRRRTKKGSKSNLVVADHLELPDGRRAEIIHHDGNVTFLTFTPGSKSFEVADQIESGHHTYLPRSGPLAKAGAILLPPPPDFSPDDDPTLFDDLCTFVRRYWIGPSNWTRFVVLYVLLTWIIHALDEVAYLRVIGDLGSAKSRLCDVLQAICYRAVRAAGNITAGVLPRILTLYPDATLVVDEADLHGECAQEVRQILRCASSRRTPVIKCAPGSRPGEWEPMAFTVFGPKVIAARKTTKDDALETRCITESIAKAQALGEVPITLQPQFWQEAAALRARLMAFRILNFGCTGEFRQAIAEAEQELVAKRLDFRTAQLGAPLLGLSDVLNHGVARESCLRVLRHHDTSVQLERGQGLDGLLGRFVEHLRKNGIAALELGAFLSSLKSFAEEEEDWSPDFIPKKQPLSRRLNTFAHVLGVRVIPRKSGHSDSTVVISPLGPKEAACSAPLPSVPITSDESDTGAEDAQPRGNT